MAQEDGPGLIARTKAAYAMFPEAYRTVSATVQNDPQAALQNAGDLQKNWNTATAPTSLSPTVHAILSAVLVALRQK